MSERSVLIEKLEEFISKYYKNLLLKGAIYFVTVFLLFILGFSFLEYFGQFSTTIRLVLFWSFVSGNGVIFWLWIIKPLFALSRLGQTLSYYQAAQIIGKHFSSVEDRLVNLLQLQDLSDNQNDLIEASIQQKINQLNPIPFSQAIAFSSNKKYLKYTLLPLLVLLLLFVSGNKKVVIDSSSRILSYNTEFVPVAPFNVIIENPDLNVIKGQDFKLQIRYEGDEIPKNCLIIVNQNSHQMKVEKKGRFSYLFKNPQQSTPFNFIANGFPSKTFELSVLAKPLVSRFVTQLIYPKYTNKKAEELVNTGNLNIPTGTTVNWTFFTKDSEKVFLRFQELEACTNQGNGVFKYNKQIFINEEYQLITKNEALFGDSINFQLQIIPDGYPTIKIEEKSDSSQSMLHYFEGFLEDDYGLQKLVFHYQILSDTSQWESLNIAINTSSTTHRFSQQYDFKKLGLKLGQGMNYYFEIWDNDGINGSKSSKSNMLSFKMASLKELEEISQENSQKLKQDIDEAKNLATQLQKDLEKLQKQLLKEKNLSWDDRQKTQELLDKQERLKEKVNHIKEQQKQNTREKNQFHTPNEELLKKQQEIDRLFENIMDQEMQEMMQELNEMMDDLKKENLQEMLESMQQNDQDIEKELDRTLELFKQMEVEQKLEKSIDDLQRLAQKQNDLSEKTKNKTEQDEVLLKEQEQLKSEFEEIQKDMQKARDLNKELEHKKDIPDTKTAEEEIQNEMQKSTQKLEQKMKNQAAKNQQNAAEKMEEMSQNLQSSMQMAEAEQTAEDMQVLRQILENLITLSFNQEDILKTIPNININSPLFLDYLQLQKRLQSDAQIIEDSLFALSKRQPKIESIVNTEINAMNLNMSKALIEMAERRTMQASEKQQLSMISANNLALLLSEALEQMQRDMANMQSKPSNKMCNKPKSTGGQSMKQMKEMQKQVKEQMKKMLEGKKDSKEGKSKKGIAELAAKQEMIRKRMGQIREELSGNKNAKNNIDQLLKQMEENEVDIINNNITKESLKRQESILSRLLEAEKAQIEREKDSRRESNEWIDNLSKRLNQNFEEYQKEKEKQEELLRTMPPSFTPFYKNKVKNYFREGEE